MASDTEPVTTKTRRNSRRSSATSSEETHHSNRRGNPSWHRCGAAIGIWGYVKTLPGTVGLVPKGAVIAFWPEPGVKPEDVCKDGWSPFPQAWGRFIVGRSKKRRRLSTRSGWIPQR